MDVKAAPLSSGYPHRLNVFIDDDLKNVVTTLANYDHESQASVARRLMRYGARYLLNAPEQTNG